MNERIKELAEQSMVFKKVPCKQLDGWTSLETVRMVDPEKFALLILRECVTTLEFHGYNDAIPYVNWMATNKLGVKNEQADHSCRDE